MMKKLITLLLVVSMLAFVFVGCGTNTSTEPKEGTGESQSEESSEDGAAGQTGDTSLSIAWVHSNASANSEQRSIDGFNEYTDEKGYDWEISTLDSGGSGEALAGNIEDAVQRGVDAIVVSMADMRAAKAALEDAEKAGIPVYSIDSGWVEGLKCDVTSNNYVIGAKKASYLVDRLGGEGKIIVFDMAEHHGVRKRGEVLGVIVSETPGIEVIAEHNIDYTNFYQDTQKTMEDYLTRFGDDIDAVYAGWDEPAMAAAAAIEAAGYSREDMFVVGSDGHPPMIEEMRKEGNPLVATVAQGFESMGKRVASIIDDTLIQNISYEEAIPSTTIYIDTPLITDKNLPEEGAPVYLTPDFYSSTD